MKTQILYTLVALTALTAMPKLGVAQESPSSAKQAVMAKMGVASKAVVDSYREAATLEFQVYMKTHTVDEAVAKVQTDAKELLAQIDEATKNFDAARGSTDLYERFVSTWKPLDKSALYQVTYGSINALLFPTITVISFTEQLAHLIESKGTGPETRATLKTALETQAVFWWLYPLNVSFPFLIALNNSAADLAAFNASLAKDLTHLRIEVQNAYDAWAKWPN